MRKSISAGGWGMLPPLFSAIAFIAICTWSQPSHANTGLWLWGWLGVADIQIMQAAPSGPAPKETAMAPKPAPAKYQAADAAKKNTSMSKVQTTDDNRSRDGKEHALKIIIM